MSADIDLVLLQLWLAGSALDDVVIAVCMTYYVSLFTFPGQL
jgi:hypothetical protein